MSRNIKTLAIVFAVLVVIALFPTLKKSFTKDQPKTVKKTSVDLIDFTKETVQKVTIKNGEETKTLMLSGDTWKINGEDSDQVQVDLFFDGLAEAEILRLASKNQENHSKFDVTKDSAIVLTLSGEDEDTTFFVGKQGPEFDSFYIRKQGIANVYLVRGNTRTMIAQDLEDWKPAPEEEGAEEATGDNPVEMNDIIGN